MSSRPLTFSDPGRFELYCHRSGPTIYPEEVHETVQICVPLERAQYSVSRQSETGRTLVHHMGSRDILAIPVGQPHSVEWRREADVVSLQLSEAFICAALGDTRLRLPDTFTVRDAFVSTAAMQLRNAMRAGTIISPAFAEAIATLIAYRVGNAAGSCKEIGHRAGAPAFSRAQMVRIERFIDEHLEESISLSTLAEGCRLTVWHFLRRFQATVGASPHAFITQRRLLRAQTLLASSNYSISRIAMEVGISHSHFSRGFLNHFGQSPREYRRQQQS
jgi:AraC family transcriptional regulator